MFETLVLLSLLLSLGSNGMQVEPFDRRAEELRAHEFMADHLHNEVAGTQGAQLLLAFSDLDGDHTPEAVAYLFGPEACGTGGCHAFILQRSGDTYRVVTRTSVTWPPIRRLGTKTNGWSDIGVWVQGGGTQSGHEAALTFDGASYPRNPSLVARRRMIGDGETLIPQVLWLDP